MSDMDFDFGSEFAAFGDDLKGTAYDGDYTMKVKSVKPGKTQKGKAQFIVTLEFQGGPLGAKGKTVEDRLIWSPESEVAAKIFAQNLRALGAPQEWIMQAKPSPQQIADQITGTVVEVKLTPDEWNNQPRTKVSYRKTVSSKPVGGGKAASPSAAAAVSLDDTPAPAAAAPQPEAPATPEPATVGAGAPASDNPWA